MDQIKEICNIILNQNLKVCIDTRSNEIINSIFLVSKELIIMVVNIGKKQLKKVQSML